MPTYDSVVLGEKTPIVFDFGSACIKYLIVNPKDRRVVVIESIMTPSKFKDTLGEILFMHFEVYEGFTILGAWQSGPLGGKRIHRDLEIQLRQSAYLVDDSSREQEGIPFGNVRACFVSPAERAALWNNWRLLTKEGTEQHDNIPLPDYAEESFAYPLGDEGGQYLRIPSRLRETASEGLFTGDTDNVTLHTLILESLLLCPIDCRRQLIENIVCIGGTCMMPGFIHRLNEEIKTALELPRYASLAALKDSIKFHNPPSKANYTAWLGGSIFGALESLPGRSYSRTKYLEQKTIPDWSSIWETDITENRDFIHTR
ncbi:unnamed protein product [Schistocephalus solidus]|uniref:Actin-related protein 10 n=1 Tax=Schistocephalus solidus TaxID=70667 RepID=A0A183SPC3_SCHSO|nr:unnamed protein product [Schistocephalus solidus]